MTFVSASGAGWSCSHAAGTVTCTRLSFAVGSGTITVNVNGCPNACARTQVADIGLKGQLVLGEDGQQVEGFQVHLGGGIGLTTEHETPFGRKLRAHKVTSAQLGDYVTAVVTAYLADRAVGETFAQWVARADEDALRRYQITL